MLVTSLPSLAIFAALVCFLVAASRHQQQPHATVPFVGCPEMEQGTYVAPPKTNAATVAVDSGTAQRLAYYGSQSLGLAAPRGWHCVAFSGSSGATLLIAPTPIDTSARDTSLAGPGIEMVSWDGGTSGRFGVAMYSSRLFQRVAASFVSRVKAESLVSAKEFERGPYPGDVVAYTSKVVAQVTTPANGHGFGTEGRLAVGEPIRSVIVLDTTGEWGLTAVRIRLPRSMVSLESVLLRIDEPCGGDKQCRRESQ